MSAAALIVDFSSRMNVRNGQSTLDRLVNCARIGNEHSSASTQSSGNDGSCVDVKRPELFKDAVRRCRQRQEKYVEGHNNHVKSSPYSKLAIELIVDFIIMYFVMFAMIATLDHLLLNLNNVYMTLMMVAPMSLVMLISMRSMFPSAGINAAIAILAVIAFGTSFYAIRSQAAIGDREFLRSMIPHHSGAILMCEQASIKDPEIVALCAEIIRSQKDEISRMQAILARY